jgi:hypothetical protein
MYTLSSPPLNPVPSSSNNRRSSILSTLGLRPTATGLEPPNHAAAFVIANFTWAYYILSSRFIKRYYRIDDNVAPREALATRGERMVKEGKITKSVLDQIKRLEGAHANSMEHFPMFFGTVVSWVSVRLRGIGCRDGFGHLSKALGCAQC